jgi:hypothetical protein
MKMEQNKMFRGKAYALLLVTFVSLFAVGCGAGNQPIEGPSAKEVSDLTSLRKIFDEVHGDETKVSPENKRKFLDYANGDQQKADFIWAQMKNPMAKPPGAPTGGFQMGGPGGVGPKN